MDLTNLSHDQTNVALNLSKHVISTEAKQRNIVFSPLLIHVVLGLIANASTSQTQEEVLAYFNSESIEELNLLMSRVVTILFADGSSSGGPCLSCTNGVWVDKMFPLKQRFREIAYNVYNAVVDQVDFKNQAETERRKLNRWAVEKTNGLIREALPSGSVQAERSIVFGNTLYFKGAWDMKFDKSKTKDCDFFLLDGTTVKAPFMTDSKKQYVGDFDGFKVLRLPYKESRDKGRFSMYIFLPDSKDGLSGLVEKMNSRFIESHLPRAKIQLGEFRIPKFKLCYDFNATRVLKGLGLVSALSGGLTEMVDVECYVSKILHKSFIEVNEEGTEAAAVVFCMMPVGCSPHTVVPKRIDFVADHPFFFVIREEISRMLLFVGQVLNPLGQ